MSKKLVYTKNVKFETNESSKPPKYSLGHGKNFVIARRPNKRLSLAKHDEAIILRFEMYAEQDANKPGAMCECVRNKIRVTTIKLSPEAMEDISKAWEVLKIVTQ